QVRLPLGTTILEVVDDADPNLGLRLEAAGAIQLSEAARNEVRGRMEQILEHDRADLAASGWYREGWLKTVIEEAPRHFDEAFNRWRELYRVAFRQAEEAHRTMLRARGRQDQENAKRQHDEAIRQLNLLKQENTGREESDFYPYRYLASEGFLPGYNFPALPVRAWVPREGGEFISRPRFLALREFGPNNILYHEGAKWEVVSFQSPPGGLEDRRSQKRFCRGCGSFC